MRKPISAVNIYAVILGIFLVIEGFWGFFSPVVFCVLTTNILHAFIHLLLGVTGIYLGLRGWARKYSLYVGILLLVVGILYFIPGADELVIKLFNVNTDVAYVNIFIGIISILFALLTPKRLVAA
ncbi:hypothetical protein BH09BAC2_BH09BAC2_19470 [soil metagenome]